MKIICLGDSFTEGFLIENNYTRFLEKAGFNVLNWGQNGDTTEGCLKRMKNDFADIFIIFAGTNDFFNGVSVEVAYKNIKSILQESKAKEKICIIPPYIEEEEAYAFYEMVNDKIDELAELIKSSSIDYIDSRKIFPHYLDGVHMGESFHRKLADKIIEKIREKHD